METFMEQEKAYGNEISVSFLLGILRKFWIILLVATILAGALGAGYSRIFGKDTYTATASFWVNGDGKLNQAETMGAAQMATNYSELATKDILLRSAVKRGELAAKWNCSEESAVARLRSMISIGKSNVDSLDAITAIQYSMIEVIAKVNGDDSTATSYVSLVGEVLSLSDVRHIGISYQRNIAIFAVIGFFAAFAVCAILVNVKEKKKAQPRSDDKDSFELEDEKNEEA